MKIKFFICCAILLFSLTALAAEDVIKSTADDQVSVEVTVYNSNLGLVKDVRNIKLAEGRGELRFMDVAANIMPVTVHAKSLNQADKFSVLEQNYEYDLMNPNKLLDKYVGKKIKIVDWNAYQDRKDTVEAELLSNNQGQIYKIDNEIYLGHPGYKVLPQIPDNLIAKPTLMWLYSNQSDDAHKLEVSYLTNSINWKADYVMVLNKDDSNADLSGWVTIDNTSGATYKNAALKLIAGEVHRVRPMGGMPRAVMYDAMEMKSSAAPQFEEKSFFEYHIYNLQRKTTIKDKQTKQISLLQAGDIDIKKEFDVYGITSYFNRRYTENQTKQPVNVYVKFKNSKENNLGMPLPAGIIRLYKADDEDSLQFIGEDKIEHTPKDEEIKLKIGEAFDIVAERKQTDYKKITSRIYETEWEVTLRNHKDEDVIVSIIEPLYGDWQIMKSALPFEKIDAFTIKFNVPVPKDEEVKLTYRVRVG